MKVLSVMTFNIWRSGGRSLDETIEVLREVAPDVVGLQECASDVAERIADTLDLGCVSDENAHAILTRGELSAPITTRDPWGGLGATIAFEDLTVHVFDAHLHWDSYGPYHLKAGRDVDFVLAEERRMRMPGLAELLSTMDPALSASDREPTFLVGDFNAPSHLDDPNIAWPTSIACEARGLADAFRDVHPRSEDHGITWTPIPEEEPHGAFDRIDFIHYARGPNIRVKSARVIERAPWPSDHRAVLATFEILGL